jgi:two-component system capsular synthesis sensor histidine kinase RcsC
LEEAGYRVEIAINGEEALGMLTTCAPGYYQIVLCDIYMPILNGVRLAAIVREREAQSNTGIHQIIIGLTAETRDLTSDIMDSCLLKPFNLETFESCVRMFLNI